MDCLAAGKPLWRLRRRSGVGCAGVKRETDFSMKLWNETAAHRLALLAGCEKHEGRDVMKELRPDEWRDVLAREFQEQSANATLQIGKQLQFKLAKITVEPLPGELQLLLGELEAKTSRSQLD